MDRYEAAAAISDPMAQIDQILGTSKGGRRGRVASRFPPPGKVRTSFAVKLYTNLFPNGIAFPVVEQTDVVAPEQGLARPKVWRQNQWIGGMGQRYFEDPTKYMAGSCHTIRMNEAIPQGYAVPTGKDSDGVWLYGTSYGMTKKFVEWGPPGGGWRRLFLVTYSTRNDVHTTTVYILRGIGGTSPVYYFHPWKQFANWGYTDLVVHGSELHLLGRDMAGGNSAYWATSTLTYLPPDDTYPPDPANWNQGNTSDDKHQERWHEVIGPDGTSFWSKQTTLYWNDGAQNRVVGSQDDGNDINAIVLYQNQLVLLKPEGLGIWTKVGDNDGYYEQKHNLRYYFDPDTGKHSCQWAQKLYFNMGKLLASFDSKVLTIEPPVWDWADPDWIPAVRGITNAGECLVVSFDGRVAAFDGADWHNVYRGGVNDAVGFSAAYLSPQRGYPILVFCRYPEAGYAQGQVIEFYPSFLKPLHAETKASEPSFLISSYSRSAEDQVWYFRDAQVDAYNLSPTIGIKAGLRTRFHPDATAGFLWLYPTLGVFGPANENGVVHCLFSLPGGVATGQGFQLKSEFAFAVPSMRVPTLPGITDMGVTVVPRPYAIGKRFDYTFICSQEQEFPDGSTSKYTADRMAEALWEGHAQYNPVAWELWQENCWVQYKGFIYVTEHVPYTDEGRPIGRMYAVHLEEV
jgi:hypothetical protein